MLICLPIAARIHNLKPEVSSVPSPFLFDIQEDQVERLQEVLKAEGVSVMQVSPLVRARMDAVNGQPRAS